MQLNKTYSEKMMDNNTPRETINAFQFLFHIVLQTQINRPHALLVDF